ncbi:MAG: hypothetical protein ABI947_25950 [Chloroflexota bacterium]
MRALVGNPDKALTRLKDVQSKVDIVKGDVTKPETSPVMSMPAVTGKNNPFVISKAVAGTGMKAECVSLTMSPISWLALLSLMSGLSPSLHSPFSLKLVMP